MSLHLEITLENPSSSPLRTTIPAGTVFEVEDAFARIQNLVTATETTVHLAPGSTETLTLPAFCMNERYRAPLDTPMRLTPLVLESPADSQGQLWAELAMRF